MNTQWNIDQTNHLIAYFGILSDSQLALDLNKTKKAVLRKAERLGLLKYKANKWNREEISLLRNTFHLPHEELKKLFPRHPLGSILGKGYFLGLFRHKDPNKPAYQNNLEPDPTRIMKHRAPYKGIIQKKIGRKLEKGETVHHIDMVSSNDNPDNLFLCKNASEHSRAHASLNRLVKPLMDKGIIDFDKESGIYILKT